MQAVLLLSAFGDACAADDFTLYAVGPVSLRYQVHNLMITFQDVGGNSLPVPAGSFFVLIDALPGSSATVTASQGGSKQLPVTKAGGQLKVAPFSIVSAAAGQASGVASGFTRCTDSDMALPTHTYIMNIACTSTNRLRSVQLCTCVHIRQGLLNACCHCCEWPSADSECNGLHQIQN